MNPQDPCAAIKDFTLRIEGVCRRLTARRCSTQQAVAIIESMTKNVDILVQQTEVKIKRLQMSLNKTIVMKGELHKKIRQLKNPNTLCIACTNSIEDSFSDDTDSSTSIQITDRPSSPLLENKRASTPVELESPQCTPDDVSMGSPEPC